MALQKSYSSYSASFRSVSGRSEKLSSFKSILPFISILTLKPFGRDVRDKYNQLNNDDICHFTEPGQTTNLSGQKLPATTAEIDIGTATAADRCRHDRYCLTSLPVAVT